MKEKETVNIKSIVDSHVSRWADEAWKEGKKAGDEAWAASQEAFIKIKDRELSKLDPAVATALEEEVWRIFANQTMNIIVQRFRKIAGTSKPTTPGATSGVPNSVHTAEGALDVAADRMAEEEEENRRIENLHFMPMCKKRLGDATWRDLNKEEHKAGATEKAWGRSKRLYKATKAKMDEVGVDRTSDTKSRELVHSDYFASLQEKIYG